MTRAEKMKDLSKVAPVAEKMIFSAAFVAGILPTLLIACAASPGQDAATAAEQSAAIARPWRDGTLRYCYPGTDRVMAEGRFSNDLHAGFWIFRYRDGAPFARGEFDTAGERTGPWLLWNRDGEVSRERSAMKCDSGSGYSGLYLSIAGAEDFEWDSFPPDQQEAFKPLLKLDGPKWSGTGLYAAGFWVRELSAEELEFALEPSHFGVAAAGVRGGIRELR